MMNNINYQADENLTTTTAPQLSLVETIERASDIETEEAIEVLAGGSINYAHYDNKARVIRSSVSHGFLRSLVQLFRIRSL